MKGWPNCYASFVRKNSCQINSLDIARVSIQWANSAKAESCLNQCQFLNVQLVRDRTLYQKKVKGLVFRELQNCNSGHWGPYLMSAHQDWPPDTTLRWSPDDRHGIGWFRYYLQSFSTAQLLFTGDLTFQFKYECKNIVSFLSMSWTQHFYPPVLRLTHGFLCLS